MEVAVTIYDCMPLHFPCTTRHKAFNARPPSLPVPPPPARAIQDAEISAIICDCIAIVACYVPPSMMLELLAPCVADECEGLRARAAAIHVAAHVVRWVACGLRGCWGSSRPAWRIDECERLRASREVGGAWVRNLITRPAA